MSYRIAAIVLLLCTVLVSDQTVWCQTAWELNRKSANGYFARMWRTAACEQMPMPRHPSVVRNGKGQLLLLVSHDGDDDQSAMSVATSNDEGKNWSRPRLIYTGEVSPKAFGTLTRLPSGRLTAPTRIGEVVKMLYSEDDDTLVTTCSYRQSDNQTRCEVVRWRLP